MDLKNDGEQIGKYLVTDSRLQKIKEAPSKSEEEKYSLIKQIGEQCVPKVYIPVLKREMQDQLSQTETNSKSKRKCVEKLDPAIITAMRPKPTPAIGGVMKIMTQTSEQAKLCDGLTQEGACAIGSCTRLLLRKIIQNAKRTASRENRTRIVPSDVDMAIGAAQIDYELACPLLKPTPSTDRLFWGRKLTNSRKNIVLDANYSGMVSNERFCEAIVIKDHWLVVDGNQPCLPENVISSEVKSKFQEQQRESQRLNGFGVPGVKREIFQEKRMTTQAFSMIQEHQVLYTEVTKILTCGSSLERQKVLETIETDTGIQFLAGRFVILIAEGVRLHIGTKNIRGLTNLLKLTSSLMKNPSIRLEKYLYVLVPSLISCVVSKSMVPMLDTSQISLKSKSTATAGTSELTDEDRERIIRDLEFEFRLREAAGRLLAELSNQYHSQNLNVRIIQVLRKLLSGNQDPVAIYGVLCTFFSFGHLAISSVVIPKMHDIYCSLQACRSSIPSIKTTMTKLRKTIVETEIERIEIVQNRTIELIMNIIFENEILNDKRPADADIYSMMYAEFGVLFYNYALSTGMINENTGYLKMNRPSLLMKRNLFLLELEKMKKPAKPVPSFFDRVDDVNDESILDNILDDSGRPWAAAAARVAEMDSLPLKQEKETFFRTSKLFLIRKETDTNGKLVASFIRPLESGFIPTLPTSRNSKKASESSSRETVARESCLGQSIYASRASESQKVLADTDDSEELLKRFVQRADDQSGAIIYGRNMMMSENGRATLEHEIAKATAKLSNVRLRNAVTFSRAAGKKEEMSRGRFLSRPPTLNTI